MAYMHGIRIQENPTSVPTPVVNETGVPVVFGTAPVNMAADPAGAVNKLVICNTFAEAVEKLGYSDDYASYSLCQAMDTFFKAFGVGPVVFCNVLDPANASHTEALNETITVTNGQAISTNVGIVLDGLTVRVGENTLVKDEDYTLAFNSEGKLVVTVLTSAASVILAGKKLKPSGVVAADVIGSVNSDRSRYRYSADGQGVSDLFAYTVLNPCTWMVTYPECRTCSGGKVRRYQRSLPLRVRSGS